MPVWKFRSQLEKMNFLAFNRCVLTHFCIRQTRATTNLHIPAC